MTPADERESPRTDPNPGTVPAEGSGPAGSGARPIESTTRAVPPSDTLLSVPQPTREDLMLEVRISSLEQRLDATSERLARLERRPVHETSPVAPRWFWLAFLAGLALAWQILARLR